MKKAVSISPLRRLTGRLKRLFGRQSPVRQSAGTTSERSNAAAHQPKKAGQEGGYAGQPVLAQCLPGRPDARASVKAIKTPLPWGSRPHPRPVEWVVEGLVQRDAFNLLAGEPGVGKTSIVMGLAAAVARGRSFLERDVERGKVLIVNFDDLSEALPRQFATMAARGLGSSLEDLGIYYWQPDNEAEMPAGGLESDEVLATLHWHVQSIEPVLIIVDSFAAAFPRRNGNNAEDVMAAWQAIHKLKVAAGSSPAVLVVDHTPKPQPGDSDRRGVAGSVQKHARARSVHILSFAKHDEGVDELQWYVFKANAARSRYGFSVRRRLDLDASLLEFELGEDMEPATLQDRALRVALEKLQMEPDKLVPRTELLEYVVEETRASVKTARNAIEGEAFKSHPNVARIKVAGQGNRVAYQWIKESNLAK